MWLALVGVAAGAAATATATATKKGTLESFLEELRSEWPDRASVERRGEALAARLLEFSDREETIKEPSPPPEGSPSAPVEVGRARLLAAEALLVRGATREAREILVRLAAEGASDEQRARALYLLGEPYFLREKYVPERNAEGRLMPAASLHWLPLAERYPASPWAASVARPVRYFKLLQGGELPAFAASFEPADGSAAVEHALEKLKGKLLVLDFWKSSSAGQKAFETGLARDMKTNLEEFPDLAGRFEILGVNLDQSRADFQAAREAWAIPWPQHHDGRGFETPLADLFGIPRLPHWVVLAPAGRLVYLGGDREEFYRVLTRELRALHD